MSQDYAKKKAAKPKAKSKKPAKNAGGSSLPNWVWFISGFAAGFFAAFLTYLLQIAPLLEGKAGDLVDDANKQLNEAGEQSEADESSHSPKFEFYNLLPKAGIDLGDDIEAVTDRSQDKNKTEFILQCGSFRRVEDAETRRAELLLLGLPASIQTVSLKSGGQTHRVIAGPYDNLNKMNKAQDMLSMNGIDSLTIRLN